MAISFPSSPSTNQTYTVGSKTWIWNGYAWDLQLANTDVLQVSISSAYNQANVATSEANSAYEHANSAYNKANSAYGQANNAILEANSAYEHANSAYDKANSINAFAVISVAGQSNVVATSATTLNIEGSGGITVTTNASSKTITITGASSATSLFVDGTDFGTIVSSVLDSNDLGSITDPVTVTVNLGGLVISGIISPSALILPSYTVSTLPNANPAAQMIFVSNESGGAVIAFSDGTNWRRVTDRAIVT